jgi:RNase H-fold protein (predicted Holliday junction resolvase)|tara:strand:+ start:744 stop:1181 length:438 start_codon:yes stop_codon:yes gene_type:complete
MLKFISIDPGKFKCGVVLVDINKKQVEQAIVLNTEFLAEYIKTLLRVECVSKVIIGNGTTSKENIQKLEFVKKDLIISEEKNTTFRSKKRYFELFPITGLKKLLPKDFFIMNKNLDALSALIILEDYLHDKFTLSKNINTKTWLK